MLDRLVAHPSGLAWCREHANLADRLIDFAFDALGKPDGVAVIATGGYGRRELSPHSDIDVTVLLGDEASIELDKFVRAFFQGLHAAFEDVMSIKVGYAYRLLSDVPGLDATTRTGLLEMRLLAGSEGLALRLGQMLKTSLPIGEFVLAKLEERAEAFRRFNDTPLVVEPNLKDGAGGLRCHHCSNWLRAAVGKSPLKSKRDYELVLKTRNLLHAVCGKQQDVLTRSRQAELADLTGQEMYEMMGLLTQSGLSLHGEFVSTRDLVLVSRITLAAGVSSAKGTVLFSAKVDAGEAAVGIALATALGIKVSSEGNQASRSVSGPAALHALSKGEATIRNLDRCGLLNQLLPELVVCRTLMPRDTAHEFTVFEHTLRAIRNIESLAPDSAIGRIKSRVGALEPLMLAILIHDAGKFDYERPHSEVGAEVAERVGIRWGLGATTTQTVSWLVREHLTMARTIRLRDLANPQTIEGFASVVQTQERLDLLTLLTYADIAAVSESAWNPALESFLIELHERTSARFAADSPQALKAGPHRSRLLRELRAEDVGQEELDDFLNSMPAHYLVNADSQTASMHLRLTKRALAGIPTTDLRVQHSMAASDVTICALDRPGLLSQMLGVLYALDLSLLGLRACTTGTNPPVALDVFTATFGGGPIPEATAAQLASEMKAVFDGRPVDDLMRRRGKDPDQRQRVFEYAFVSGDPAIIEIRAPRGRGMAYRFSRLLAEQGWIVVAARLSQWAGQGAAAFYVTGPKHRPLGREAVDKVLAGLR